MKKVIWFFGLLVFLPKMGISQQGPVEIVLKTGFSGKVEWGSVDTLITRIQEGRKLRIGWELDFDEDGQGDLEHWIDAGFISILNGHVFNQIAPIYRQVPNGEIPQIEIVNSKMQWTGIIGTNGKLISRYVIPDLHLVEDEELRAKLEMSAEIRERLVATTWAVLK